MVRAILDGRKTQTRRVVRPQPVWRDVQGLFGSWAFKGGLLYPNAEPDVLALCPYGQPGDRLWVRETCAMRSAGGAVIDSIHYAATPELGRFLQRDMRTFSDSKLMPFEGRWTPSIYMPRWASRITLEITGVRVERLQGITEGDAHSEGAADWAAAHAERMFGLGNKFVSARAAFQHLWESINGTGSWDLNPWVWVVEFKRVEQAHG